MNEKEQKLREEILRDAELKAERRVARAKSDAEKLIGKSRRRQERARKRRVDEVTQVADEKCRAITASIEHEKNRRWLLAREEALDAFFEAGLGQLEASASVDPEQSLRQLLEEALQALGTGELVIQARPMDAARLAPDLLTSIAGSALGADAAKVNMSVEEVEGMGGGLILLSTDGRRRFDNTYATRLTRMKRDLRATVCAGISTDVSWDTPGREEQQNA